jgi:hypothetical protein
VGVKGPAMEDLRAWGWEAAMGNAERASGEDIFGEEGTMEG